MKHLTYRLPAPSFRFPASLLSTLPKSLPSLQQYDNLRFLRLDGPITSSPLLPRLAPYFPSLTSLGLNDFSLDPFPDRICSFLDSLANPQTLTDLSLDFDDRSRPFSACLADTLSKLTNLARLALPEISLDPFYPILRTLPLHRLELNDSPSLTVAEVCQFLEGPSRIGALREIQLNNLEDLPVKRGSPIPPEYPEFRANDGYAKALRWRLAKWSEGFSTEGFENLLELAEKEGVKVSGEIIEAKLLEDEWRRAVSAHHGRRMASLSETDFGQAL